MCFYTGWLHLTSRGNSEMSCYCMDIQICVAGFAWTLSVKGVTVAVIQLLSVSLKHIVYSVLTL